MGMRPGIRSWPLTEASFILCHPIDATSSSICRILGELGPSSTRGEMVGKKELCMARRGEFGCGDFGCGESGTVFFLSSLSLVVSAANSQLS